MAVGNIESRLLRWLDNFSSYAIKATNTTVNFKRLHQDSNARLGGETTRRVSVVNVTKHNVFTAA